MPRRRAWLLVAGLLLAGLPLTGCEWPSFLVLSGTAESQNARKAVPPKLPELKTVGTYTSFWGVDTVQVHAVGVVVGLEGRGSNPPPGEMRLQALRLLKVRGVADPEAYLASGDAAVVAVRAFLPPGLRKDEPLDVDVELIPEDKQSNLRGGELLPCDLYEYADANQLSMRGGEGARPMRHKRLARAAGPLSSSPEGDGAEGGRMRRARVWGGGKSLEERNFALVINSESQEAALAVAIAEAINRRFHGEFRGAVRGMAEAKTKALVTLRVPNPYRHNWLRYLRVIRQLPLRTDPLLLEQLRRQYAQELLDPAQTIVSALRLEALGADAVPQLKQALHSAHPLVRFAAAESLAYLGEPACGEVLAEVIRKDPALRALGLTALASLDEAVSHVKLRELIREGQAELRFGAFRALHAFNPNDRLVTGELINKSFHLHQLAPDSPSLVHLSTVTRPEVVLFGEEPLLLPPFSLLAGPDFTVTAKAGDSHCVVSRISARHGTAHEKCSLRVSDIIRTLGRLGGQYGDVVDLLRQAAQIECLSSPLAIDALPQAPTVYELAERSGHGVNPELGGTPNLFARLRESLLPGEKK
jgi:hypothetical protein